MAIHQAGRLLLIGPAILPGRKRGERHVQDHADHRRHRLRRHGRYDASRPSPCPLRRVVEGPDFEADSTAPEPGLTRVGALV